MNLIVCDNCEKRISEKDNGLNLKRPFMLTVTQQEADNPYTHYLHQEPVRHFCSRSCLSQYYKNN